MLKLSHPPPGWVKLRKAQSHSALYSSVRCWSYWTCASARQWLTTRGDHIEFYCLYFFAYNNKNNNNNDVILIIRKLMLANWKFSLAVNRTCWRLCFYFSLRLAPKVGTSMIVITTEMSTARSGITGVQSVHNRCCRRIISTPKSFVSKAPVLGFSVNSPLYDI